MLTLVEYSKRIFIAVLIIAATLIIPYLIYKIFPHFIPFFLAYFTALIIDPLSVFLMKKCRFQKTLARVVTFLIFLAIIALLAYLIINKIYVQLLDLLSFIQSNGPVIQLWILDTTKSIQDTLAMLPYNAGDQINNMLMDYINQLSNLNIVSKLVGYTYSISTAIPNAFFLILIYLISVFLFSFQLENIQQRFYSIFKETTRRKVVVVLGDLRRATFGFLKAQAILSTITFIIAFIGLSILGVKYSALMAFVIIIVDILPILGTGSVLIPWAIFSIISSKFFLGIGLILLFVIITVIRKAIEPKVLGERIGLSALATLISIWVGFKFMGVVGVFLFPLAFIFLRALFKVKIIQINYRI
jgi:sporulation integral membrane protein YtvI